MINPIKQIFNTSNKQVNEVEQEPQRDEAEEFQEGCSKKINYKESGTYKRVLSLVIEDALANINDEVTSLLGYQFVNIFKRALKQMREQGYAFAYYEYNRMFYSSDIRYQVKQGYENSVDIENKYEYFYKGQQLDSKKVLIFGDLLDIDASKLEINREQARSITNYENALSILYNKFEDSYAWIVKSPSLMDYIKNPFLRYQQKDSKKRFKDFVNRKASSVVLIDKDEEVQTMQLDLNWIENFLHEYKLKICADFNYPYSKFFQESVTGLNSSGEGERNSYMDFVKNFQMSYIYPPLLKLAKIVNKEDGFKNLSIQYLSEQEQLLKIQVNAAKLNQINVATNSSLLPINWARKKALGLLEFSEKEIEEIEKEQKQEEE